MTTTSIILAKDQISELIEALKAAPITGSVDRIALFWALAGGLTDIAMQEQARSAPVDPALFADYQADFDCLTDEEIEQEVRAEMNWGEHLVGRYRIEEL